MKVKIEIDCTPLEARSFLGLPDVSSLNAQIVEEMKRRIESNMALLQPSELMKTWSAFGSEAQSQFQNLMATAADAALSGRTVSKL